MTDESPQKSWLVLCYKLRGSRMDLDDLCVVDASDPSGACQAAYNLMANDPALPTRYDLDLMRVYDAEVMRAGWIASDHEAGRFDSGGVK